jgi:hypothetical protein
VYKKSFPPYEYIPAPSPAFYDIILISLRYYFNMVIIYTKKWSDRLLVGIYHSLSLFIASLLISLLCSSFDITLYSFSFDFFTSLQNFHQVFSYTLFVLKQPLMGIIGSTHFPFSTFSSSIGILI